jgi:hypothetical protein
MRSAARKLDVAQPDAPRLNRDVAGYAVDERRLSGAVGADQPEYRAFFDLERDAVDGVNPAEVPLYLSELQQGAHG